MGGETKMIPSGVIAMWYGSIVSIPNGWTLCDGTAGTPDLRDRFIWGAGGRNNPGDTGGTFGHTHPFTGDGHTHQLEAGIHVSTGYGLDFVTDSTQVTGTTDNAWHVPPFHCLAFIMKT